MPKTLYLMRHAEAASKGSRQEDKSRDLTQSGMKDSLHMGAWFGERNIHWDLIASSSAVRAEQTASLVAEGMKLEHPRILLEDILYDASVRQFLEYVNTLEDAYHSVLIVGHNPSISYLAEYLTKGDTGDMAAGSAVIIRFEFSSWKQVTENSGVVDRYVTPESVVRF